LENLQANINSILLSENCNGPGRLISIHFQGCDLGCRGCYNPHMFSFNIKHLLDVSYICDILNKYFLEDDSIEGVSFLGGEPIYQIESLLAIIHYIKSNYQKSCILFTGFYLEEVRKLKEWEELLLNLDLVILGRFDETKKTKLGLPSSSNQEIIIKNDKYRNISKLERYTNLLFDFEKKVVIQTGYPVKNIINF